MTTDTPRALKRSKLTPKALANQMNKYAKRKARLHKKRKAAFRKRATGEK